MSRLLHRQQQGDVSARAGGPADVVMQAPSTGGAGGPGGVGGGGASVSGGLPVTFKELLRLCADLWDANLRARRLCNEPPLPEGTSAPGGANIDAAGSAPGGANTDADAEPAAPPVPPPADTPGEGNIDSDAEWVRRTDAGDSSSHG
ncbi:hypothetical protein I4F81_007576 [Pyropia yezoensis]|uniref:Uncharacterized protein n=1 Tax=Pyropia yezoensis TaxID=2788 RepID=A0ACC3C5L9_PYRYE|nr:hypothetical protein I4F81_007576 [Neopyropia yezoensis]